MLLQSFYHCDDSAIAAFLSSAIAIFTIETMANNGNAFMLIDDERDLRGLSNPHSESVRALKKWKIIASMLALLVVGLTVIFIVRYVHHGGQDHDKHDCPAGSAATALPVFDLFPKLPAPATLTFDDVQLRHMMPSSIYDKWTIKNSICKNGNAMLIWGTSLQQVNLATIQTIVRNGAVSMIEFPDDVTAHDIHLATAAVANVPTLIVGRFSDAMSAFMKQKIDAGLSGVVLGNPVSVDNVRTFVDRALFPPLGKRSVGP